jgi:hypothetical protein
MWNPVDALKLRDYLVQSNGSLISHLSESTPSVQVTAESKVEGVALQGAFKEGYIFALQRIKEMSVVSSKQDDASSSSYITM